MDGLAAALNKYPRSQVPGAASIWTDQPTLMGFTIIKPGSLFTGQIFIRPGLPWAQVRFFMAHESVHMWMTPANTTRQWLRFQTYQNSQFLRAAEEMTAQFYALNRSRVGLLGSLRGAIRYPFMADPAYANIYRFLLEGAAITGGVAALGYGGYKVGELIFEP